MSMLKGRILPLAGVAGLGALLWTQTRGGAQAPRSRTDKPESQQSPVSETLQSIGGQGGQNASDSGPGVYDPKDTRLYSKSPDAQSKKNPGKVRDLDRDKLGPVNPAGNDGKHIGDRDSDLPWKRGEGGKGA
ncbi:hypothetical protein NKR19_g8913 [Coniochaeta hoffmannii]|uniref:Uncharacterized protein n=1 Tax=Coniochaeta hoffmannii TaxID=91930 RepID=A0AA38VBV3_9PEZI|nr:hypothetical protein NKR19_g8913 [Coniochaeta hoffmannii]